MYVLFLFCEEKRGYEKYYFEVFSNIFKVYSKKFKMFNKLKYCQLMSNYLINNIYEFYYLKMVKIKLRIEKFKKFQNIIRWLVFFFGIVG